MIDHRTDHRPAALAAAAVSLFAVLLLGLVVRPRRGGQHGHSRLWPKRSGGPSR